MFEYINGIVEYKKPEYLAIDVNGIGYKTHISLKTYDKIKVGEKIRVYIYNFIKEDAFKLIGFLTEEERVMFELLLSVSGIGVSLALSILSSFETEEIRSIVINEDFKTLKNVPKLGEKKSKQIILDLKTKIETLNIIVSDKNKGFVVAKEQRVLEELYLALDALGYSKKEIDSLVTKQDLNEIGDIETAIKFVLKKINSKK